MKFDEILREHVGEFGRYQKIQYLLICLPVIFTALHSLSWTFIASPIPHRCRLLNEDSNSIYRANDSLLHQIHCNGTGCSYDECRTNNLQSCDNGYVYDNTEVTYSAIQRWDIVCDRKVLKAIIQSLYYVGQGFGSIFFGFFGDRYGRKPAFFLGIVLQCVSSILMVIAPNWWQYGLLRIGTGFAHPGLFSVGIVLGMELVGPSKRKLASIVYGMVFSVGQIALGTLAYFIRDYQFLQLAISAPILLFLIYWWLVPESARWLLLHRRFEEANCILKKAAKINGKVLPDEWWEQIETDQTGNKSRLHHNYTFFDLIRTKKMRSRTLACFFLWPVVSMVYYGVSMKTDFLGGDFYLTFIFGGLSEIPALLLVYVTIDRFGRKRLLAAGYFTASICILSNMVFSSDVHWLISTVQFILTKASITAGYAVIYTITPELFPTVVRNIAMGCCSMIARVGAVSASYISMWIVEHVGIWAMVVPFGTLAFIAGLIVIIFIPETSGQPLLETIAEVEEEQSPEARDIMPKAN